MPYVTLVKVMFWTLMKPVSDKVEECGEKAVEGSTFIDRCTRAAEPIGCGKASCGDAMKSLRNRLMRMRGLILTI